MAVNTHLHLLWKQGAAGPDQQVVTDGRMMRLRVMASSGFDKDSKLNTTLITLLSYNTH